MGDRRRLRIEVRGAVQGVGFRPFAYRLAHALHLDGWVVNDTRGVIVEVEGDADGLEMFLERLTTEKPEPAAIASILSSWLDPAGFRGFRIERSDDQGARSVQLLPDIATCSECRREVNESSNRRFGYPFTNCTHCGPRFSIMRALPYDRPRTTMEHFIMCPPCKSEYENPADRRFHAQPNACDTCGPQLELLGPRGESLDEGATALGAAVQALRRGETVAVKGLGGFHLMVDAGNPEAIARLRVRKPRRDKPLAVMVRDLQQARELCEVSDAEARLLESSAAPIVLLRKRNTEDEDGIAPGNPNLGLMLPYTPLHDQLMRLADGPLVATSGNLSDEPICIDEIHATRKLGGVADLFLIHDRPIARHVDDSIAWIHRDEPRLLRRARGYAPRPILMSRKLPTVLAVGAHLKNTVALSIDRQAFISQHIGDMESPEALDAFERVAADFLKLYGAAPIAIAHDLHPDYITTRWAQDAVTPAGNVPGRTRGREGLRRLEGLPLIPVQHHHAHLAACLAENEVEGPALGVTWDGTGFGTDKTIWGGEFLLGDASSYRRVAQLRPFRLPGGEAAVREPRRSAISLLWSIFGEEAMNQEDLAPVRSFRPEDRRLIGGMLERGINAPETTSAGRLFDAIAALCGLHPRTSFEGQAAMALEFVADRTVDDAYSLTVSPKSPRREDDEESLVLEWRELVEDVVRDVRGGVAAGVISARFHNALADAIVAVARTLEVGRVALTGGCFQNRLLVDRTADRLRSAGHEVLLHSAVPPNDGGISLGQIAVASAQLELRDDT